MPVSGSFFHVLGATAAVGRVFTPSEDRPGVPAVAVISYGLWQRRYDGDPEIVGRSVSLTEPTLPGFTLREITATIVGVAPRGFHGVDMDLAPDLWLTLAGAREGAPLYRSGPGTGILRVMARLRAGVSRQQAQAEIDVIAPGVFQSLSGGETRTIYSGVAAERPSIRVEPATGGFSALRDQFRAPLRILMPLVAFVLLMACSNVAALLLARSASRHKELAIRLALGSGRLAIVRLLVIESVLLTMGGGGLALLTFRWVRDASGPTVPRL